MKLLLALLLSAMVLSGSVVGAEPSEHWKFLPGEDAKKPGSYSVTGTDLDGNWKHGRAPEACEHEWAESEYFVLGGEVVKSAFGFHSETVPATPLDQCAKCNLLRAPLRLKEEK